jgi:hypothetical protein
VCVRTVRKPAGSTTAPVRRQRKVRSTVRNNLKRRGRKWCVSTVRKHAGSMTAPFRMQSKVRSTVGKKLKEEGRGGVYAP